MNHNSCLPLWTAAISPHQRCTNKTAFFNEEVSKQHLFILQDSAGPLEIVTFPQTSPKSSVHAFDFRDVTERNAPSPH
jgi:hypothetical protein